MRYERIIRKVMGEPWLITRAGHAAIVSLIESRLNDDSKWLKAPMAKRPQEDWMGQPMEQMSIENGIATIPIKGVIGAGFSAFEKSCGAVDTADIAEDIDAAIVQGAKAIILDIDSPGGTVGGTPELADYVRGVTGETPVLAFSSQLMASAAYWIGSSGSGVYATRSADVGSIGVYLPWIDSSEAFKARGLNVDIIKAGKLKGMGYPGTSLTEEQRQHLQDGVNEIYEMFTGHVCACRGDINSETMQGQTFIGQSAKKAGLVDEVVSSLAEVQEKARQALTSKDTVGA